MRAGEQPLRLLLKSIDRWLSHPATTEVVVNQPGEVGVEQQGRWTWHDVPELSLPILDSIGILAASMTARTFGPGTPICSSTLPDGQRIQICRPPVTRGTISLTIRKPSVTTPRVEDADFPLLFGRGRAQASAEADARLTELYRAKDWPEFFREARRCRKTIGVTGATGSGKTHMLKRLLALTPEDKRVVTIEDTPEFGDLGPRNRVNLFYGDGGARIAPEDLLAAALRMRPDEIWMQEVRGAEAFAFLRALAAGHPGGCTSWHAEEGREWDALELMVKQHPAGLAIPEATLRGLLRTYIEIVVWCERSGDSFSVPRVWFRAAEEALA